MNYFDFIYIFCYYCLFYLFTLVLLGMWKTMGTYFHSKIIKKYICIIKKTDNLNFLNHKILTFLELQDINLEFWLFSSKF